MYGELIMLLYMEGLSKSAIISASTHTRREAENDREIVRFFLTFEPRNTLVSKAGRKRRP